MPPKKHINFDLSKEADVVVLTVQNGDEMCRMPLNAADVTMVLAQLAEMRQRMRPPVQTDPPLGTLPRVAHDAKWWATPDHQNEGVTLMLRDPGYGWIGYMLPIKEASNVAEYLNRWAELVRAKPPQRMN